MNNQKLRVRALARNLAVASAEIQVSDVQSARRDWELSKSEAFLARHSAAIAAAMIAAGLAELLRQVELEESHDA